MPEITSMYAGTKPIQCEQILLRLSLALQSVLGIVGGSGGPNQYNINLAGSGLRIRGGWHVVNHVNEPPLFAGETTIAMARDVYGIKDPSNNQMKLF